MAVFDPYDRVLFIKLLSSGIYDKLPVFLWFETYLLSFYVIYEWLNAYWLPYELLPTDVNTRIFFYDNFFDI